MRWFNWFIPNHIIQINSTNANANHKPDSHDRTADIEIDDELHLQSDFDAMWIE